MDLLLVTDKNKSHYEYIKDFERFVSQKKKKKIFCKTCLQCFSGKIVLIEHKKIA